MLQVTPQMKILVAIEPVDFRRGIDGLARLWAVEKLGLIEVFVHAKSRWTLSGQSPHAEKTSLQGVVENGDRSKNSMDRDRQKDQLFDSPARLCQESLRHDPFVGAVFVFRNRKGTALKLLMYDGQGFWLCHKTALARAVPVVALRWRSRSAASRPSVIGLAGGRRPDADRCGGRMAAEWRPNGGRWVRWLDAKTGLLRDRDSPGSLVPGCTVASAFEKTVGEV